MGKTGRRKKRTHNGTELSSEDGSQNHPKTFVIERGNIGNTLKQLVSDIKKIMEPYTATHLRATKRNVLKDFISVAGPMGVTHFITISKTTEHVYLRIARLPRGPTITFRVTKFSLGKEVITMAKKPPPVSSIHYMTPPVLVLNSFPADNRPSQLITTMLQNMYPTLNVQTVKLSDLRRCVLYSYNKTSKLIDFRHYAIKIVPRGMSRGVRKIAQSKLPNLSRYEDISEYVLGGGASESEAEEADGEVTLGQDLPGRGNIKQQQSSVRLYEIGPRLTLQLIKIESGLFNGEVLHHELVQRTKEEIKELKKRILKQKRLKINRKKTQEQNVKRKEEEKENKRRRERQRQGKRDIVNEEEEDDDDEGWYTQEVGVAPDPDLLLKKPSIGIAAKKRRLPGGVARNVGTSTSRNRSTYPLKKHQPWGASRNDDTPTTRRHRSNNSTRHQPSFGNKKTIRKTGTVFRRKSQRT